MFIVSTWERRAQQAERLHQARVALARSMLARLTQDSLAAVAEAAIGMMDDYSDPDEDHCLAGDDGCGAIICGGAGGVFWGSSDEAGTEYPIADYGLDQREILRPFGQVFRVD
jgi:alkanesulfonate monooxygenase SsuD/methylene tetrahydromethanopterin reductase-like flavin-dependent oxidoreductase (luciferase family)